MQWVISSQPTHLPAVHGKEGSSFLGLVYPNDTADSVSVVVIKHCDSSVVYWVYSW